MSPRLRADLVVNNLAGWAFTTGRILIQSDGTPWRPLVHVGDVAAAFLAVLEAPRDLVHDEAFNVGRTEENYRVRQVAEIVADAVPGSRVEFAPGRRAGHAVLPRRLREARDDVPGPAAAVDRPAGVAELLEAYRLSGLTYETFAGDRFTRLEHVRVLMERGALDERLRWRGDASPERMRRAAPVGARARGNDGSDA